MSIDSMTSAAFARRKTAHPELAPQADAAPPGGAAGAKGGAVAAAATEQSSLTRIVTYIPSEVLTVYVAVIAALGAPAIVNGSAQVTPSLWGAFIGFLIATPIVVWLAYAGRVRSSTGNLPKSPKAWPYWEMSAATIAFLAWGFALPQSPFSAFTWYNSAVAGVAVLVATTAIGLLAPVLATNINE